MSVEQKKQAGKRTVRFRIRRCEGPGKSVRWESFDVEVDPGMNVISCLQRIASDPVTIDGKKTTPVVWDSGCLEEVCGACTMVINGVVRQSCSCLIDAYAPGDGDEITLEPMTKFPVVRDLWVDRSRMFHNLQRVQGWVPIDGLWSRGEGPQETQDRQEERYVLSTCMTCGCCLEACPQFRLEEDETKWDRAFIGASTISQVRYFNDHPTGRVARKQRLDVLSERGGVSDCGNAQNCVRVCPKEIPLTESIAAMGRSVALHQLKRFFVGDRA